MQKLGDIQVSAKRLQKKYFPHLDTIQYEPNLIYNEIKKYIMGKDWKIKNLKKQIDTI